MSFIRNLISAYRVFQYRIFDRHTYGIMDVGVECSHTPFEQEVNNGDVVHPCVRYIPEGYLGYKWWMVYTPYYKSNDKTENPILCYADSNEDNPPSKWIVKYQVQAQPRKGYNSDPVLLYCDNMLHVMWRESDTDRCDLNSCRRATFGAVVHENKVGDVFGPLLKTSDAEIDSEVSPFFYKSAKGKYGAFAMHLQFHSRFINKLPKKLHKVVSKFVTALDVIGIYGQQKCYGIAQWSSTRIDTAFKLDKTVKFINCNKLYRPWHFDFFVYKDKIYSIVQTNQCNADICLAESVDGVHFRMYNKPLMTNATSGRVGIYKPTGGVVGDVFYLYYTAQNKNIRGLNKLYLTQCNFSELLKQLQ